MSSQQDVRETLPLSAVLSVYIPTIEFSGHAESTNAPLNDDGYMHCSRNRFESWLGAAGVARVLLMIFTRSLTALELLR